VSLLAQFLINLIQLVKRYQALLFLGIVSAIAELAYAVMNQSAIQPYVREIGLTTHLGIIYVMFLAVETAFKSPMGSLGDKLGRRPLIVGGALISCLTALGMAAAHKLEYILVLRAFDGLAAAAIWPTVIAAIGGSVPAERRSTAMGVMTVAYIIGISLGPFVGGFTNDYTNSRIASFYLVSLLFFITAVIAFFLTPQRSREDIEAHAAGEGKLKIKDLLLGIKALPDMMLLAFMAFFGIGLLIPIVKLFAMDELHLSETGFGVLVLPIAIVVGVSSIALGNLGDRWGKVRSVRVGLFLSAFAMWGVASSNTAWQFAVAGILLGTGFVMAMPAWLALVADIAAPKARGAVIGALGTAQGIGAAAGAYVGPKLYDMQAINLAGVSVNPQYAPFIISAATLTICVVLGFVFVKENEVRRIGA